MLIIDQKHIRTLRNAGCSYQQIANILNMPKSTVKNHCLRHGITLPPGTTYKSALDSPTDGWKVCPECYQLFRQLDRHDKKFCSDKCRNKCWRKEKAYEKELEAEAMARLKEEETLRALQEELDLLSKESYELDGGKPVVIGRRRLTAEEIKAEEEEEALERARMKTKEKVLSKKDKQIRQRR